MRFSVLGLLFIAGIAPSGAKAIELGPGLFDVSQRRAELQLPELSRARDACLAFAAEQVLPLHEPVPGLYPTAEYGMDQSAEPFAWAVMVLGARDLAGDQTAGDSLIGVLTTWAAAGALKDTPTHYDAFYALKRTMLPTMVAYRIVAERMLEEDRRLVHEWIDGLVRRLDVMFDGDVDHNNHRFLADLVLMTWGSISGDLALYSLGLQRYAAGLAQARSDGSLPLETRRGARAVWYSNMAIGELALIAGVARTNGDMVYGPASTGGTKFMIMLAYLMDLVETPELVLAYSVENYIPGPIADYRQQDMGFMERRGHDRHYMAWMEALIGHAANDLPPQLYARLGQFFSTRVAQARPLIDEYAGGNATCFWMRPGT